MSMGLYVGSFDPITLGHIDVIKQALQVFDSLHIGIGINPKKTYRFTTEQRIRLIRRSLTEEGLIDRVTIGSYDGSMMQEARDRNATALVRGLRQMSDFNDEFLINGMVSRTLPIPLTYFICKQEYLHVSSSAVKEMASLGEDYHWMVPRVVALALNGNSE